MLHERFSHKSPYRASLSCPECALALIATQGLYLDARSATGGIDQYNMTGGLLEINGSLGIAGNADTSTYQINLGGGTVKSNATWASGSPMTFTGTNGNVTFDTNGNTVTLNGLLSGAGGLIKDGAGTLTFNADNTYAGSTVIDGGTLVLNTPHFNTYRGAGVFINNGSTFRVTRSGGANRYDFTNKTFTFDSAGGGTIDTSSGVNFVFWNPGNTFVTNGGAQNSIIGTSGFNVNTGAAATFDVIRGSGTSDLKMTARIWNGGSVVKTGDGILEFTGNNTYAGPTTVSDGVLALSGSYANNIAASPTITVAEDAVLDVTGLNNGTLALSTLAGPPTAPQTLQGSGTVVGSIGGSGMVSPGTSPGILTATAVSPSDGLDFAFEFTATGSPDYTDTTQSVNDVLRLTDPSAPFAGPLGVENVVDVYLDVTDLSLGDTFRGGFYTDRGSEFLADIVDGTLSIWIAGSGGSREFGGKFYYAFEDLAPVGGILLSTVPETALFATGSVDGYVMQLSAVPEPSTLLLAALGMLGLGIAGWRRRRRHS